MKTYEKILIAFDIILTVICSLLYLGGSKFSSDAITYLFGTFLMSYFIAFIISKFSKSDNKKLALWKIFIKFYPVFLIFTIINSARK
ncbi:MAG: hypothetical protein WC682_05360 [Parcubacteria group bacterium]